MKNLYIIPLILTSFSVVFAQNEPSGKISGLVYADYYYNAVRDTGFSSLPNTAASGQKDIHGFDLRRLYFTYDHKISDKFTSRFRLEADGKTISQNNKFSVFVKDAYIKWNDILPGQDIVFGIQPTPAFEKSEAFYGFRSLEKTILDLRNIVASRDFGIAVRGKVSSGMNYWVMYGNNSPSSPETDKYKRIYAHLYYIITEKLQASIYGDILFRKKITAPVGLGELSNNTLSTALFLGYSPTAYLNIGGEVFYQSNQNSIVINNLVADREAIGISLFGSMDLTDNTTLTARYDYFDPSTDNSQNYDKRNLFIFGLSYKPVEDVSIIPNVVIESYEDLPGRSIDASVTPRVTVAYIFN